MKSVGIYILMNHSSNFNIHHCVGHHISAANCTSSLLKTRPKSQAYNFPSAARPIGMLPVKRSGI
jgi:hypothetical protein